RVRIPVVGIFEEIAQIPGLLGVERLTVIVRLELIEHRELTDLVERDSRQLVWHDGWKEPLFVASHVVESRDRRVEVPRRYELPRCDMEAGRDGSDRRQAEDNLGDPLQDAVHKGQPIAISSLKADSASIVIGGKTARLRRRRCAY